MDMDFFDPQKKEHWFALARQSAAFFNDPNNYDSMFLYCCGFYYDFVENNFYKAVEFFSKSADLGFIPAIFNLGQCYFRGEGVRQNYETAIQYWIKAADEGSALSQYEMGYSCEFGEGVPINIYRAIEYYSKAADQGHPRALYDMGDSYFSGRGGSPKDWKIAIMYYLKSAEQGIEKAKTKLEGFIMKIPL